jgi:hypothetical protein
VDQNDNLIADDQSGNGSIDVIAPPYTSAKVLVGGLPVPTRVSLNKAEDLIFSANAGSYKGPPSVTIYAYPSGSLVKTLGSSKGITAAGGVAVSPNAVF